MPVLKYLTHIELSGIWDIYMQSSAFGMILAHGVNIESLRICGPLATQHSAHFRRYPRALPHLREFGLDVRKGYCTEADLFPAIVDFLAARPQLEFSELLAAPHDCYQVGLDPAVWNLMSTVPNLRGLSISVSSQIPIIFCANSIPRGVRWLKLAAEKSYFTAQAFEAVRVFRIHD
jgi:hypothetical protein